MQKVEVLYRLQTVDLDLEDRGRRLQDVESRLGESEELHAARAAAAEAEQALQRAAATLREREDEVAHVELKLKEITGSLYSGKSRPAKELANLQKEAEHLKSQKSKLEDEELEAMSQLEEREAALAVARRELAAAEAKWREEQQALAEQQQQLQAEVAKLTTARAELVKAADPAHLPVYESLRKLKGGRAVARVEQNICGGCRIIMAMQQVQHARTNPGLSLCSSCGRILYVPR